MLTEYTFSLGGIVQQSSIPPAEADSGTREDTFNPKGERQGPKPQLCSSDYYKLLA